MPATRLLRREGWTMLPGERAAVEGVLSFVRPDTSIEIGTHRGGSLEVISAHSRAVHAFDVERQPTVTPDRFPNVTFHIGDSHGLLPVVLGRLSEEGASVDFALVDGDHHAAGVRRDVEDLLSAACTGRCVILLHDTLNESVRTGLESVDFAAFPAVTYVDLDFVSGRVMTEGPERNELWYGLGLVVTGDKIESDQWPGAYSAPEVYRGFSATLERESRIDEPIGRGQLVELQEDVADLKNVIALMEGSLSWKLTRPLRAVSSAARRIHRRSA